MDNEWLDFFDIFADYDHPAEEYETAFVKYCISMIYLSEGEYTTTVMLENISANTIKQVYDIMQMVTKLNFRSFISNYSPKGLLYYSWGKQDSEIEKEHNYDKRGAFLNLDFEEYDKMLYYIIKSVLLDAGKSKELKDDVLLWYFITTLHWEKDFQNEYLRLIKIVLNHNIAENHDAWYECQGKGQYLYYSKYTVYGIPQYYGEHINPKNTNEDINKRHLNMFLFNRFVIPNVIISNMLNRKEITNNLMNLTKNTLLNVKNTILNGIERIIHIINLRIELVQKCNYYENYLMSENAVFGIIEKIENPVKYGYYLGKVKLSWPTRGYGSSLECWVRLKCKTDLMFLQFNEANNEIVKKRLIRWEKNLLINAFGQIQIQSINFWIEQRQHRQHTIKKTVKAVGEIQKTCNHR